MAIGTYNGTDTYTLLGFTFAKGRYANSYVTIEFIQINDVLVSVDDPLLYTIF